MRNEFFACSCEGNDFIAQKVWFDRRDAYAVYRNLLVKRLNQFQEGIFMTFITKFAFAIIANVHPRQNYFRMPLAAISFAFLTTFSKVSEREIPRASGMVQYVHL